MEKDRFYIFASPWFWTHVGRFVRYVNFQEIEIADAIYFTRTGATFDVLRVKGLNDQSKYHGPFETAFIPSAGVKYLWLAKTPWVKEAKAPQ